MKLTRTSSIRFKALFCLLIACMNLGYSKDINLRKKNINFIENKGQILAPTQGTGVLYYVETEDMNCFLRNNGISYVWKSENIFMGKRKSKNASYQMDVIFLNANKSTRVYSEDPNADASNFYLAHCPEGILNVKNYNKVVYENIYSNIDLVLYVNNNDNLGELIPIKYDFIVKPGGNPADIKIQYNGCDRLKVKKNGSLTAYSPLGELSEGIPYTYQAEGAMQKEIKCHYQVREENILSFDVAAYNKNENLVIDPSIQWSTYYGGSSNEAHTFLAVDGSGNVYAATYTASAGLHTAGAYQTTNNGGNDMILVKFDGSGSRLWATYFGGTGWEMPNRVCLDASGSNVYIAGKTSSTTSISSSGFQSSHGGGTYDAFLVKFNSSGAIQWSTYYGGSGEDEGTGVVVDGSGNVYMSGNATSASGSLATVGSYDASMGAATSKDFLVKFTSAGARSWATYYGYNATSRPTTAVDSYNNVYISGSAVSNAAVTSSGSYQPSCAGGTDAYLAKFNSSGTRLWATYFGGSGTDYGLVVKTDPYDNVFMAGSTLSSSGIASPGAYQTTYGLGADAYLAKFNYAGTKSWSTYYGGNQSDVNAYNVALVTFSDGKVCLGAATLSTSAIATSLSDEISTNQGGLDGYIAKFNHLGTREWGTYVGGSQNDWFSDLARNSSGDIFFAGYTMSTSGIATVGAYDNSHNGAYDTYIGKIAPLIPPTPTITVGTIVGSYSCGGSISVPYTTTGTFNLGNIFSVQLSDATGSFSSPGFPVTIATGSSSPIGITLPYAPAGTNYRIRIVSSNPVVASPVAGPFTVSSSSVATGANFSKPVNAGTLTCTTYSDTKNNSVANCYGNDYDSITNPLQPNGQPSPDIYYKFTLGRTENVKISTCGSGFDTYVHLLNSTGTHIASNNDNGPVCAGTAASIERALSQGTYYVVVEGNGSSTGSITTSISMNSGLLFDGVNDNVELNNHSALNLGSGDFTMEAFIYSNKTSGYSSILDKRNIMYDGFVFGVATNGRIWMQMYGTNISAPISTPNIYDSKCHHLAVTRDGADSLRFYVDGTKVYTTFSSTSINSTGAARMGWDMFFSQYFQGYIRDVRVWNVARTQTEIAANMQQLLTVPQTGLVGYWRLFEGTGQTVADLSGNSITGTLGTTVSVESTDPAWSCQAACPVGPRETETLSFDPTLYDSLDVNELDLKIYPNPFTNATNILVAGDMSEKMEIVIQNMKGAIVYRNKEYLPNQVITLGENFNTGFYIVKVSGISGTKVLKLVKTR